MGSKSRFLAENCFLKNYWSSHHTVTPCGPKPLVPPGLYGLRFWVALDNRKGVSNSDKRAVLTFSVRCSRIDFFGRFYRQPELFKKSAPIFNIGKIRKNRYLSEADTAFLKPIGAQKRSPYAPKWLRGLGPHQARFGNGVHEVSDGAAASIH